MNTDYVGIPNEIEEYQHQGLLRLIISVFHPSTQINMLEWKESVITGDVFVSVW